MKDNFLDNKIIEEKNHQVERISAECLFYEPESETEGFCIEDTTKRYVSRLAGCNNPEGCQTYINYLNSNKLKRIK